MRIFIHIEFSNALNDTFFGQLDRCFEHLGYLPGNYCQGFSNKDSKWVDVVWKNRAIAALELLTLKCEYLYSSKSDWDTIWVELPCKRSLPHLLVLNTSHDFGYNNSFTKYEKDQALRIEALALSLHKTLNANDTAAWSDYHLSEGGEPWFRFSKEEWKPLGELPIEKTDV
jgi:hypothetical protein